MIIFEYLIILLLAIFFLKFFLKIKYSVGSFFQVLDQPNKEKIHTKITPLVGSYPIFLLSLALLIYLNLIEINKDLFSIFIFSYFFFLIGYFDDRFSLNAYFKLGISIIIVTFALYKLEKLSINKIYIQFIDKHILLGNFKFFFSTLCILLLINSLNLSDGINGLASGFVSIWLMSLALITSSETIFFILIVLSSFCLINTFLIINGKYFLGDSGTLFLGSLVGFFTIFIYNIEIEIGKQISVEKIFIFFMIPGVDMFRLFLIRLINKKDPFSGDLNHLHHLMLKKFSLNTTLVIYLLMFIATNIFSYFDLLNHFLIILLYLSIYVFFIFFSKKKFENSSS